jgi:hypothetical protein
MMTPASCGFTLRSARRQHRAQAVAQHECAARIDALLLRQQV